MKFSILHEDLEEEFEFEFSIDNDNNIGKLLHIIC